MSEQRLYRVVFQSEGEIIEIFARSVGQGSMFGFVEIGELVFGETSSVVIDPSEEKLRSKFADVSSFFIPIHAVQRIDVVTRKGTAKVRPVDSESAKVTPFPIYTSGGTDS